MHRTDKYSQHSSKKKKNTTQSFDQFGKWLNVRFRAKLL